MPEIKIKKLFTHLEMEIRKGDLRMKSTKEKRKASEREIRSIKEENRRAALSRMVGPSHFELEYFRQIREEIDIFLHSKGFTTIKEVHIDLFGPDFRGHLQISA